MRYISALLPALSLAGNAAALAMPKPQDIDFNLVDSTPDPLTPSMTVGLAAQTVTFDVAAAIASISSAVAENRASPNDGATTKGKRDGTCAPQDAGFGPTVNSPSDTASAFLTYQPFGVTATTAEDVSGYTTAFTNLTAANNAYGYLGYVTLPSYSPQQCAANCNGITGCSSFNLYFERDPTIDPCDANDNPPSTTNIKCVYFSDPVTVANAVNDGKYRKDFQVVIAGSNGYVSNNITPPPGYRLSPLGTNAINAPLDSCNANTYMGVKLFTGGQFDPSLCAAACSAQSLYNLRHSPKTGCPQTCQFFNTYISYKNNVA